MERVKEKGKKKKNTKTYVIALVHVEIRVHISLVSAIHSSGHARPWLLKGQHTLDVVSVNLVPRYRIDNDRLDAEKGERGAAGLGGSDARKRSDDVGARLGLPVCL